MRIDVNGAGASFWPALRALLARQERPAFGCCALRSACISSVLSPDAGRMADVPQSDGDQYRSKKMDDTQMQHLQRIAAWAGASILLQALLLGTGAICYHGIAEGVEAYRFDKSGRITG